MELSAIIKVVAKELGTSDLKEINKLLKAEPSIKFRITSKTLGHYGFTGQIKSISEEGVKVFMANKVSLIRLKDIETFEKAKPREERPVRTSPKPQPASAAKPSGATKKPKAAAKPADDDSFDDVDDDEDDDYAFDGDEYEEELRPKKLKKSNTKPTGKSGSRFIPTSKK